MKPVHKKRPTVQSVILAICVGTLFLTWAMGQEPEGLVESEQTAPETVIVYVRHSKVLVAPWPVKRVSVTDPEIADVQLLTDTKILLQGKSIGGTDVIMWGEEEQMRRWRIEVQIDLARVRSELKRLFPRSRLDVTQAQEVIVVTGLLSRSEHAQQLKAFMDAAKFNYVDMSSVAGVQQVLLKVRIAEVSRVALRMLGINAFYSGDHVVDMFGGSTIGSASGGAINPISIGVAEGASVTGRIPFTFTGGDDLGVSSSITLFGGFPDIGLQLFLQALAENQYLRVLAEPNLVALSGQEATFLAGGEYPIPIVQGTGGGTSLSVEYREFGVSLRFVPTVLGDGGIRLLVAPEVSELSDIGAVTIEGFSIPSLRIRKARTTLELKSGQTFAMAGLISKSTSARTSRVPGLGSLPILGALFRSVRYQQSDTELVVLVTASLVEPMSLAGDSPLPGSFHVAPDDWELYGLGRTKGEAPAKLSPAQLAWLKKHGLDRLKGPGGWARHGQGAAPSGATVEPVKKPLPSDNVEAPSP